MKSDAERAGLLQPEEGALLTLLRFALFPYTEGSAELPPGTDWEAVFAEAGQQTVLPLALEAALSLPQPLQPPGRVVERFRSAVLRQIIRNETLMAAQDRILQTFSREGIPCVVLKGSSVSVNYPRPELRILGDIDILVNKSTLEEASLALLGLGYHRSACNEAFHLGFAAPDAHVELHFEAAWFPDSAAGRALRGVMADAAAQSQNVKLENHSFPVLTPARQAVSLLFHMQQHLKGLGIGLRHLCDFAVFLPLFNPGEWESSIAPALREGGLLRFAEVLAKTCVLYLGLPAASVPWCMHVQDAVCRDLLAEFLVSGNFGRKDPGHRASAVLAADKGGQGAGRFMPLNAIRNLNLYARSQYPLTRRIPLLLPFFWLYLPLRYLRETIKTGGKPAVRATLSAGRRRQKLFAQLGIFDVEQSSSKERPR